MISNLFFIGEVQSSFQNGKENFYPSNKLLNRLDFFSIQICIVVLSGSYLQQ